MAEEYEFEPELEAEPEAEPRKRRKYRRFRRAGRSGWAEFLKMVRELSPAEIRARIRKSKSPRYRELLRVYGLERKQIGKLRRARKPKRRLW